MGFSDYTDEMKDGFWQILKICRTNPETSMWQPEFQEIRRICEHHLGPVYLKSYLETEAR